MRNKCVGLWACALLWLTACCALFFAPTLAAQEQEKNPEAISLLMASPYNILHPVQKHVFLPWIEDLRAQSKGYINIETLDANAVLIEADLLSSIVSGALPMGAVLPTSTVPNPPVSTLLNFYIEAPNSRIASRLVWDVLQQHQALKDELQLLHILWAWSSSPAYLHTISRPVRSLMDVQGMKLLVWSKGMEKLVTALGGIPIMCLPAETGPMLSKGMAEGAICPLPPLHSFGVDAYIRYTTDIPLEYFSFYMGMNHEIWAGLPDNVKQLFIESTGTNLSEHCGAALDAVENQTRKDLLAANHTFVPLNEQERMELQKHLARIRQHEASKVQALQLPNMTDFTPLIHSLRQKYAGEKEVKLH